MQEFIIHLIYYYFVAYYSAISYLRFKIPAITCTCQCFITLFNNTTRYLIIYLINWFHICYSPISWFIKPQIKLIQSAFKLVTETTRLYLTPSILISICSHLPWYHLNICNLSNELFHHSFYFISNFITSLIHTVVVLSFCLLIGFDFAKEVPQLLAYLLHAWRYHRLSSYNTIYVKLLAQELI